MSLPPLNKFLTRVEMLQDHSTIIRDPANGHLFMTRMRFEKGGIYDLYPYWAAAALEAIGAAKIIETGRCA